jgi:hypothetical protein
MATKNYYFDLTALYPNIGRYVDALDKQGQIDLDSSDIPFVLGFKPIESVGGVFVSVNISRNNKMVLFNMKAGRVTKPRNPVNTEDGWERPPREEKLVIQPDEKQGSGKERRKIETETLDFQTMAKRLIE